MERANRDLPDATSIADPCYGAISESKNSVSVVTGGSAEAADRGGRPSRRTREPVRIGRAFLHLSASIELPPKFGSHLIRQRLYNGVVERLFANKVIPTI